MPKDAVFTMKIEPELRDEFMAEAQALDRPASQVLRDLMREFVQRQQAARLHEDFVQRKVAAARQDAVDGRIQAQDEVETAFAARRAKLRRQAGTSGA